ncbi:MAG TPA: MFS transporter [Candidatus Limnocylindrales bacterium]
MRTSLAGYPPTIRLLFATQSLTATSSGALYPFIGLYITERFHVDIVVAGVVSSLFFLSAAVASPIAGALADRVGRRPVIVGGLAGDALFIALLGLAPSLELVALAVVGAGLSGSAVYPALSAVVADIVPADRRAAIYGSMYQALGLGWFAGPLIATPLLSRTGFVGLFVVGSIAMAFASALTFRRLAETHSPSGGRGTAPIDERGALALAPAGEVPGLRDLDAGISPDPPARAWFRDRRLIAYVTLHLLSFGAYIELFNIFPVDGRDRLGLAADAWAAILAVNGAMILFGQPFVSRIAGRFHKPYAVAAGVLTWAVGFSALGIIGSATLVLPAVIVLTIGEMTVFPLQPAVVAELAPPEARGRYQGALTMGGSIGNGLAPTIAGLAVARIGGGWWVLLGGLLVGLAAGYVAFGRRMLPAQSVIPRSS